MPKTQYFTAASIDGFVADADNSLDWLLNLPRTPGNEDRFRTFFAGVGAMAMGATTYEWVLDHERMLDNPAVWREYYGDTPCWVFTHRELPAVPGVRLAFVEGDVRDAHRAMTEAAGDANVWLVGGGGLAGQFAAAGLIDQLVMGVAPVTLGAGAPLLPYRMVGRLRLAEVARDGDFVSLTYDVT
ncbi:MAG: dihydrofolate reductase family protein [Actinocatenispora sp.]